MGYAVSADSALAQSLSRLNTCMLVCSPLTACVAAVVGCRVPAMPPPTTNGGKWAETWGYKLGNDANATALPGVIQRFLGTRQRAEDAKTFVQELREVFATQREYVFYSSSLLLVY
eukprot:COSAG03_NODE_16545_length_398_cov_1.555184_2_plen_115_part_01